MPKLGEQGIFFCIVLVEKAGVVEILVDPCFQILQLPEVDDEAVGVRLMAGESERDGPVMPVNEGAVPIVPVLAVGEGDVAIDLFASEHGWIVFSEA